MIFDISVRGLVGNKAQWNVLTRNGKNIDTLGFMGSRELKVGNGKPHGRACGK